MSKYIRTYNRPVGTPLLRLSAEPRNKTCEHVYECSCAGQAASIQKQPGPDPFLRCRPLNAINAPWSDHRLPMSHLESASRQIRMETRYLFYALYISRGGSDDNVAFIKRLSPQAHRIRNVRIIPEGGLVHDGGYMQDLTFDVRLNYTLINLQDT